ncbi:hypothetical protein PHPALM_28338 [Phytophthora palmivora]|uniref:PDZ domain-containing protein n=1 Tax=Phytophthora palmivora TaxID=4796 RepID=A0A2P4XAB7_9STRA|nr:hypothetical protein PHPALM_28338 [Phytophthora palmivora]
MQFDTVIDKTEKGFGIIFAKVAAPYGNDDQHVLVVDGFVETTESYLEIDDQATTKKAIIVLQLGDILIKVNGEECIGKEVAEILDVLRAADVGPNTLSFSRNVITAPILDDDTTDSKDLIASMTETPKSGLMGAFLTVKSKIRAEIDGGREELLREQLEDELFEKQWLEEFEMLKGRYEAKWETLTRIKKSICCENTRR